jgi:hypothetical protein
LLAGTGTKIDKISPDGRSLLHLAAELTCGAEVLAHLFSNYVLRDVDRQDRWNWTPLHHAFYALTVAQVHPALTEQEENIWRKVEFLIEKGADPTSRGVVYGYPCHSLYDWKWESISVLEYAAKIGDEVKRRLDQILNAVATAELEGETDEEAEFHDAYESII